MGFAQHAKGQGARAYESLRSSGIEQNTARSPVCLSFDQLFLQAGPFLHLQILFGNGG